jgi:hypothetical protein
MARLAWPSCPRVIKGFWRPRAPGAPLGQNVFVGGDLAGLPTRRLSLQGRDLDGGRVLLVHSVSRKLYRCPGCRASIPIGAEHVLVRRFETDGPSYHQHWHRACSASIMRELQDIRTLPAG